jgi:protein-S-isoprenylcysteine O-methyltransferase Ste14
LVSLASVLYVVFLLLAFGWRSWVRYRATGDSGYRGFSGDAGWPGRAAGILSVGSIALSVANGVVVSLGLLSPIALPQMPASGIVGSAFVIAGAAFALTAQAFMGLAWRIGVDPDERLSLVRSGPFNLARNPFFTGMLVATIGMVVAYPTLLGAAGWLLLALALEFQVRRVEEPYLACEFGAEYAEYAREVGRFAPWLGRLRPPV